MWELLGLDDLPEENCKNVELIRLLTDGGSENLDVFVRLRMVGFSFPKSKFPELTWIFPLLLVGGATESMVCSANSMVAADPMRDAQVPQRAVRGVAGG